MRKYFLVVLLFALTILLLTGCRCEPSEVSWRILMYEKNVVFVGDAERKITCYGIPTLEAPYAGFHDEMVTIQFSPDGSVVFKPGNGEVMEGSYTYQHNGLADTAFTVILDNGESFSGTASSHNYGSSLEFIFRGMRYCFGDDESISQDVYDMCLKQIPEALRSENRYPYVCDGFITKGESGYLLEMDHVTGPLNCVLDESVAVYCVRVDAENHMIPLDALEEGECFCAVQMENDRIMFVTIYYLDSLPEEDPTITEPEKAMLSELVPWINELNAADISQIKLTKEYKNLPAGYTKYHQYITDETQIRNIIAMLQEMEMTEATADDVNDEDGTVLTLQINEEFVLTAEDGFLFLPGEQYWIFRDFPELSYQNAVQSFIVSYPDLAELYDKDTHLGTYTDLVGQIEFVEDPEDPDYMTSQYLTLICEFGEIHILDATHFWYKGEVYLITGDIKLPYE